MKRILVPVDGSSYSAKAMEKAQEIARAFGSTIVITHVLSFNVNDYFYFGSEIENRLEKELRPLAAKTLEDAKASATKAGFEAETVLLEGNPADAIVEYANSNDFDLVVMGSHGLGRRAITRFVMGSVAERVVHYVEKPILIVK
jgi:nucleotide-binding universal stress UspA family protein